MTREHKRRYGLEARTMELELLAHAPPTATIGILTEEHGLHSRTAPGRWTAARGVAPVNVHASGARF